MKIMLTNMLQMGCIIVGLFLFLPNRIQASHIVGGDLTYRCLGSNPLGGNNYEIRLVMRRDCLFGEDDAPFDNPAHIGFFDGQSNQLLSFLGFNGQLQIFLNNDDTLNQTFISDCTIAGSDVCVQQTTYIDTIFLPFRATGYQMAYQRCCRNVTLANIQDPLNTGMTLVARLGAAAQAECNSNPQFQEYPPIYICVNKDIDFDHGAIDAEGDSLVYSLCAPCAGGDQVNNMPTPPPPPPYDLVAFQAPYSLANIMGGTPLVIDPVTGRLTGRPNTIGQFVVGICVSAYRNGELTGETRRDFQYNVRACRDVPVPSFTASTLQFDNLTVEFENTSVNADQYTWIFDFGNPGSVTTDLESPTYTFPAPGFYNVALIVNDEEFICIDTAFLTVGVFLSDLESNFSIEIPICDDAITVEATDLSTDPTYDIVEWNWLLVCGFDIQASVEQNPTFIINEAQEDCTICLTVTDENGCTDMSCQTFDANNVVIDFIADPILICNGGSTTLINNGNPEYTYTWAPTADLDFSPPFSMSNPLASPSATTTYFVTVTDGLCEVEGQVTVSVQALLNLNFNLFTDCKSLQVTTENLSEGNQFFWDFGDPAIQSDTSRAISPTYTYNQPGVYLVTLASRDGCDTMLTKEITISTITEMTLDTFISCFGEPVMINPDFNPAYTYSWAPADLLDNANTGNPIATVVDDTWFRVTITDTNLPGCSIVDSALVIRNDDFDIMLPDDMIYCEVQTIVLVATATGPGAGNLMYQWFDQNGMIAGNDAEIEVTPENTTEYTVIGKDSLGCTVTDNILIQVPTEFDINLPNDTVYCEIQPIIINVTGGNESITYTWFDDDGNMIGTGTNINVMPTVSTKYYVIGTDSLGCTEIDSMLIQIPLDFSVILPRDSTYCDIQEITLTPEIDENVLTCIWYDLDGNEVGTGDTIEVEPMVPTTYIVICTDTLGCSKSDTITLTPTFFDVVVGDDEGICLGETVDIGVINMDMNYDLSYTWSPLEGILSYNADSSVITVSPETTTEYSVLIQNNEIGCEMESAILVTVFNFNPLNVELTCSTDSLISGESIQLTVNQSPNYTYEWSSNQNVTIPGIFNPLVTLTAPGAYTFTVTVTNEGGCTAVLSCSATVFDPACDESDIFIPNAFSPNGDGENDDLFVRGNFILDMELHIYNRWGEEVFTTKDQNTPWDGTFGGKDLTPDVYGYYLTVGCPGNKTFAKQGNITLFR